VLGVVKDRLKTPCVALVICAPAAGAWLVLNVLVAVCAQKALNRCRATWHVSTCPFGSHAIASRDALRKWTYLKELLDTPDALSPSLSTYLDIIGP